jgi:hypothetical protein
MSLVALATKSCHIKKLSTKTPRHWEQKICHFCWIQPWASGIHLQSWRSWSAFSSDHVQRVSSPKMYSMCLPDVTVSNSRPKIILCVCVVKVMHKPLSSWICNILMLRYFILICLNISRRFCERENNCLLGYICRHKLRVCNSYSFSTAKMVTRTRVNVMFIHILPIVYGIFLIYCFENYTRVFFCKLYNNSVSN